MGRHPFAGRFAGPGDMPIERAIAEYRFAYGPRATVSGMRPPPFAVDLDVLPAEVSTLFRRAFEKGAPSGRPLPQEWLQALSRFRGNLAQCSMNGTHLYWTGSNSCPWCALEGTAGVTLFGVLTYTASFGETFSLTHWEDRIARLRLALSIAPMPAPAALQVPQSPEHAAAAAAWNATKRVAEEEALRRARASQRWAAIGGAIQWPGRIIVWPLAIPCLWPSCLAFAAEAPPYLWALLATMGLLFGLGKHLETGTQKTFKPVLTPPPLITSALAALASAEEEYADLATRWRTLASGEFLVPMLTTAQGLCDEYRRLSGVRERRLAELTRTARERQLLAFLASQRIEHAYIPDIGASRKATLRSYGIETAADINPAAIRRIDGFGDSLTSRLSWWRSSVEQRFKFDPTKSVPAADLSAVDAEVARLKAKTASEIQATVVRAELRRQSAEAEFLELTKRLQISASTLAASRANAAGMSP